MARSVADQLAAANARRDLELARLNAERAKLATAAIKRRRKKLATYGGAEKNRATRDWKAPTKLADDAILPDLPTLIARSRQMCRDNPHARSMKQSRIRNVVGKGITPAPAARFSNGNDRQRFNEQILRLWNKWAKTPRYCDTEGKKTFYDIQRMAEGEMFEAGQFLIIIDTDTANGPGVPDIRLQLVDADRLDMTMLKNSDTGNEVRGGVEVDTMGRPVRYWLTPSTSDYIYRRGRNRSTPVDADRVIDLFHQERPGQTRGVPAMAPVMRRLRDLDDYDTAERWAAQMCASIGLIINRPSGPIDPNDGPPGLDGTEGDDYQDADGNREFDVQPGMVFEGGDGEEVKAFNPQRPSGPYEDYTKAQLRAIAAGGDVSYEQLARDFTGGTYSSQRQSLLEDRRSWSWRQDFMIDRLCIVVWREFVTMAALQDLIAVPTSFFTEFDAFCECEWKPDGWDWVDPAKQAAAAKLMLQLGLTNLRELGNERGTDWREILRQRATEQGVADELEIILPWMEGRTAPVDPSESRPSAESRSPDDPETQTQTDDLAAGVTDPAERGLFAYALSEKDDPAFAIPEKD